MGPCCTPRTRLGVVGSSSSIQRQFGRNRPAAKTESIAVTYCCPNNTPSYARVKLSCVFLPQKSKDFSCFGLSAHTRRAVRVNANSKANVKLTNVLQDKRYDTPQQKASPNGFTVSPAQLKALLSSGSVFPSGTVSNTEQLAAQLGSSLQKGLTIDKADFEARRQYYGENKLPEKQETTFWEFFKEALEDFTVGVLIIAGLASILLDLGFDSGGDNGWIEGAAILFAVVVVVMVTAVNNYQKEKQFVELNALQKDVMVRVVRDGKEVEVGSDELLVGDVLVFEAGDIVPADGLLFNGHNVRVDESNLTGESDDVEKDPQAHPVMFSGSKILEGVGRMFLTAVGTNSQQGQIMSLATGAGNDEDSQSLREETLLQTKLSELASQIGQFGLLAGLLATAAMSAEFSYEMFWLQHNAWSWLYLNQYLHFIILGITILVVAIPEGLPLATTIGLAYSVKRMLADNNLVRHLAAAETMGCATTICCDKTGTLTQNDMAVVRCNVAGTEVPEIRTLRQRLKDHLLSSDTNGSGTVAQGLTNGTLAPHTQELLGAALAVNSTAGIQFDKETGEWVKRGNRTECALLELAAALGSDVEQLRREYLVLQQYPFSSERKRMSTLAYRADHSIDGMICGQLFTKGAAEIVLSMCDNQLQADGTVAPMTDEHKQQLLASFGKDGRRMLCVAYREMFIPSTSTIGDSTAIPDTNAEQHLTFLAMMGLEDPLRPQVEGAIKQLQRAGITVRMLTGDNAITAFSIARQCGIVPVSAPLPQHIEMGSQGLKAWKKQVLDWLATESRGSIDGSSGNMTETMKDGEFLVMESASFRKFVLNADGTINQEAFNKVWPKLRVLARCTPLDKYTIVKACKSRPEEIVAMTGDGTNDAPALRLANVGFAMASGTSIAKDASDILLLDDNLDSIVQAVKWGRNVYAGATKFLQFQLTINIGAVVTATLGAFVLRDSPLAAIQMLWVNLIMDSLASLSLATETPGEDTLDRPPYSTEGSLVTPTVLKNIVGQCVYQLSVMYWLVFQSSDLLGYPNGALNPTDPSIHYTMVFNSFVMMQLFNQINARKLRDEQSVLEGISHDKVFVLILGLEALIQALLVQFGGQWFQTTPLDGEQWAICIGFGAASLVVREGLKYWRVGGEESNAARQGGSTS